MTQARLPIEFKPYLNNLKGRLQDELAAYLSQAEQKPIHMFIKNFFNGKTAFPKMSEAILTARLPIELLFKIELNEYQKDAIKTIMETPNLKALFIEQKISWEKLFLHYKTIKIFEKIKSLTADDTELSVNQQYQNSAELWSVRASQQLEGKHEAEQDTNDSKKSALTRIRIEQLKQKYSTTFKKDFKSHCQAIENHLAKLNKDDLANKAFVRLYEQFKNGNDNGEINAIVLLWLAIHDTSARGMFNKNQDDNRKLFIEALREIEYDPIKKDQICPVGVLNKCMEKLEFVYTGFNTEDVTLSRKYTWEEATDYCTNLFRMKLCEYLILNHINLEHFFEDEKTHAITDYSASFLNEIHGLMQKEFMGKLPGNNNKRDLEYLIDSTNDGSVEGLFGSKAHFLSQMANKRKEIGPKVEPESIASTSTPVMVPKLQQAPHSQDNTLGAWKRAFLFGFFIAATLVAVLAAAVSLVTPFSPLVIGLEAIAIHALTVKSVTLGIALLGIGAWLSATLFGKVAFFKDDKSNISTHPKKFHSSTHGIYTDPNMRSSSPHPSVTHKQTHESAFEQKKSDTNTSGPTLNDHHTPTHTHAMR